MAMRLSLPCFASNRRYTTGGLEKFPQRWVVDKFRAKGAWRPAIDDLRIDRVTTLRRFGVAMIGRRSQVGYWFVSQQRRVRNGSMKSLSGSVLIKQLRERVCERGTI
jgi:hypothetical protein